MNRCEGLRSLYLQQSGIPRRQECSSVQCNQVLVASNFSSQSDPEWFIFGIFKPSSPW